MKRITLLMFFVIPLFVIGQVNVTDYYDAESEKQQKLQLELDKRQQELQQLEMQSSQTENVPPELQEFFNEESWRSGRIVGGEDAEIEDYPWQVAFLQGTTQFCAGSIIDEEWILTAAHCLAGSWTLQTVRAGVTNKTHTTGQDRSPAEVIIHPQYQNPTTHSNDIALVRLSSPLDLSGPYARKIPIVTENDALAGLTDPGVISAVTGWGALSQGGSATNILQVVMVPIVSNEDAMNPGLYNPGQITPDMLCAGDLEDGGIDACQGDSGGPLAVPDGAGWWKLGGITSWGVGCAQPGYPGVYARVSYFEDWIGEYVEFADPDAPAAAVNFTVDAGEEGALEALEILLVDIENAKAALGI